MLFTHIGIRATYLTPAMEVWERWVIVDRDVQVQTDDNYARLNERRTEISLLVAEGEIERGAQVVVGDEEWTLIERIVDDGIEARYVARAGSSGGG